MVFAQDNRPVIRIAILLLIVVCLAGCKKLNTKDPIVYDITAVMPHNDTPVPGVKYRIVEYKYKTRFGKPFGDQIPTGWELTGVTDSQGKASGSFKGVLKTNYDYFIYFDYGSIVLPQGISEVEVMGPQYDQLNRSSPGDNSYAVRVLPYMMTKFNFTNLSCHDIQDIFRYKKLNLDEYPYQDIDNNAWLEGAELNGCVNIQGDYLSRLAGHYAIKWEAIRGGVQTTGCDTFYVAPGGNDQIDIEW